MTATTHGNTGHGHVWPRPDGMKARCGGPGLCAECSRDKALRDKQGEPTATPSETHEAAPSDERLREAWPLHGYAPGNYMCHCHTCDKQFVGDKRAVTCLECAVIEAKADLNRRSVTTQASEGAEEVSIDHHAYRVAHIPEPHPAAPQSKRVERLEVIETIIKSLNITDQELLRMRNGCEGNDGQIKIWAKMLQMIVDHVRELRQSLGGRS